MGACGAAPVSSALLLAERRIGLVIRVSTDRQALNPEGSLTNQLQRHRQHIQCKREVAGELRDEVAIYELRGCLGQGFSPLGGV